MNLHLFPNTLRGTFFSACAALLLVGAVGGCAPAPDAGAPTTAKAPVVKAPPVTVRAKRFYSEITNGLVEGTAEYAFPYVARKLGLPPPTPLHWDCRYLGNIDEVVACLNANDPFIAYRVSTVFAEADDESCRHFVDGIKVKRLWLWWQRDGRDSQGLGLCVGPDVVCPDRANSGVAINGAATCELWDQAMAATRDAGEVCEGPEGFSPTLGAVKLVENDYDSVDGDLNFTRTNYSNRTSEFNAITASLMDTRVGIGTELNGSSTLVLPYTIKSSKLTGPFTVYERISTVKDYEPTTRDELLMFDEAGEKIHLVVDPATQTAQSPGSEPDFVAVVPPSGDIQVQKPDGSTLVIDDAGRTKEQVQADGNRITFAYDAAGRLASKTNSAGRKIQFLYDSNGQLASLIGENNEIINYQYINGKISRVDYPDGRSIKYLYDEPGLAPQPMGLITGRVEVFGNTERRLSTITYNAGGEAVSAVGPAGTNAMTVLSRTPDALVNGGYAIGGHTLNYIDGNGTNISTHVTAINGVAHVDVTNQPAGAGCAAAMAARSFDADGELTSSVDFNGNTTRITRDVANRTVRVDGANLTWTLMHPELELPRVVESPGLQTQFVYNGWPAIVRDSTSGNVVADGDVRSCAPPEAKLPNGKPLPLVCEAHLRAAYPNPVFVPRSSAEFLPPSEAGFFYSVVTYTYNARGQVLTNNDNGRVTQYTYAEVTSDTHRIGDMLTEVDPLGRTTRYLRYDGGGRALLTVDPDGITTERVFDVRGRLQSETRTAPDGSPPQITTMTYYRGSELLETVTQPDGTRLTYGYDDALRNTKITDNSGNVVDIALDAAGKPNRHTLRDAGGRLFLDVGKSYDALGRLQFVSGER